MNDLTPLTIPVGTAGGAEIGLHELSFEAAVAVIAADPDHPTDVKSHWPCSLRRVAAFLDRPMALVPARWTAVRIPASRLKATRLGVTQKTLANHLSNVRAALAWMRQEKRVPARGMRLSLEWEALRDTCPKLPHRARLLPLMRFCSDNPNLASGVLQHIDRRVTEEHYNRATSISAARQYAEIVKSFRA